MLVKDFTQKPPTKKAHMYKNVLKNIKHDLNKKEDLMINLWKNSDNKHAIHDKLPHFIFSAENPLHESKLTMSHDETVDFLKQKGYNAESMSSKYGEEAKSIIVHNPPSNSFRHLNKFAQAMGQGSSIISDGYDHEMHYLNGPKADRHHKGKGTVFHKDQPDDFYSTLSDGSHFTHGFDFDNTHKDSDFIKDIPGKIKKSEDYIQKNHFNLKKSEDKTHPLDFADSNTKLIHYSPQKGLKEISPEHHGVRKIGAEDKQGAPEHKMAFYYAEGVEPESIVTSHSKSKYVTSLGNKKIYDIAKDKDGIYKQSMDKLLEASHKKEYNKGLVMPHEKMPAFHQAIKDAGYHGIFNSSFGKEHTMSHAVGMFESMTPDSEHKLHPNDFKETSATDHHAADIEKDNAKNFAEEHGHHNAEFLHGLKNKLDK